MKDFIRLIAGWGIALPMLCLAIALQLIARICEGIADVFESIAKDVMRWVG